MTESPGRRPRRNTSRPAAGTGARGRRSPRSTGKAAEPAPTEKTSKSASARPRAGSAPRARGTGPGRRARVATIGTVAAVTSPGRRLATSKLARQIAVLAAVLCAVALSLAYPLRNYLDQRAGLADATSTQQQLEQQVAQLQAQQAALSDPNYIREQAKRRLQYVAPGDTVYVVQAPEVTDPQAPAADAAADVPWYATLWGTLTYGPEAPAASSAVPAPTSAVPSPADTAAVSATAAPTS